MFEVNEMIHGFKVNEIRKLADAEMVIMEHVKSGASLIWLNNGEDNKLFSIAFKTTPVDDTGVFHILEHSVLNGSLKYPVKEPFVELLKSSMNTFLNAMTFPDKTVYPVSSRNEQDFENLMSVYLDAVFEPNIYRNPNIFYQEGWHYELRDEASDPVYKGVVFNEMKGAFSGVDTIIDTEMTRMLYKDSCYSKVSGGDPVSIPDLTYEKFIETHSHFYHPSNARIYLDGAIDIDKTLKKIDEEYLNRYEREDVEHDIPLQVNSECFFAEKEYPVAEGEDPDEAGMLALGKVLCRYDDKKAVYAAEIIADYLFGSNDAPLKRALLKSGLLKDADCIVNDGIYQPYITTVFRNLNVKDSDEILSVYTKAVAEILANGLDHDDLLAAMNQFEFKLREKSEPTALYNNINVLSSWLYDGDPELYLSVGSVFEELRSLITEGYFEDIYKQMFIEKTGLATLKLIPSSEEDQKMRDREALRLKEIKAGWSNEEVKEVIRKNEVLDDWQKTPDTREQLASLPLLDLKEVSAEPMKLVSEESEIDGVKVLYHPHFLPGITYLNLYFSMNDVDDESLYGLGVIGELLANLPTEKYGVSKIQQLIRRDLGALSFGFGSYANPHSKDKSELKLCVSVSVLNEKVAAAMDLVKEILLNTKWDESDLIREIYEQNLEYYKQSIIQSGHAFAIKRAVSNYSADGAVKEKLDGYENYCWLKSVLEDDEKFISAITSLKETLNRSISNDRLTVSICAENLSSAELITSVFGSGLKDKESYSLKITNERRVEAIEIPSGVSYAIKAACIPGVYNGSYKVMSKIATFSYLWNEVRVKGGAYGTGMSVGESDVLAYYSYRDPSPENSLRVYDEASDFIKEFIESDEVIDKYIISTIADFEPLVSCRREAAMADSEYFRKVSYEDRVKERKQVLSTTKEGLRECLCLLDECKDNGDICLVGNADGIKKTGIKNIRQL